VRGLYHTFQAVLSYVTVLCGVTGLLEEKFLNLALPSLVLNSNQAMEVVLRNIIIHPQPIGPASASINCLIIYYQFRIKSISPCYHSRPSLQLHKLSEIENQPPKYIGSKQDKIGVSVQNPLVSVGTNDKLYDATKN